MQKIKAEYIWIDGSKPVAKLRSKTKILDHVVSQVSDIPEWGFDGSSTQQAEGHSSDCVLKPVYFVADVVRGNPHILVMFIKVIIEPDCVKLQGNMKIMKLGLV